MIHAFSFRCIYFFLKIRLNKNKIIIAPIAPVSIAPIQPEPRLILSFPNSQVPTKLPTIPMIILPIIPNPLTFYILLPGQPANAPIISVAINPIF